MQIKKTPWGLQFSLKSQLSFIHFFAIILFSILLYLTFKFGLKYWYLYILNSIGELITKNIADIISHMIVAEDYISINAIINKSCENNLIYSISVFSSDNIKIVNTISDLQLINKDIKEFLTAINWQNQVVGYLHLTLDTHYLLSKIEFLAISATCLVTMLLVLLLCITYLCVANTEKYIQNISSRLYNYFSKNANQHQSPILQLWSLLLVIRANSKDNFKNTIITSASIAIKIQDNCSNSNSISNELLQEITDKIAMLAVHCGKYFLANIRLIKNSEGAFSLLVNKNTEANRVVLSALAIKQVLAETISKDTKIPIGIGVYIWPYNKFNLEDIQNKLGYALKLADSNQGDLICISQKSVNYLSIAGISYSNHSEIPNITLFKATTKLADKLKNDIIAIKKIIENNNDIKK